MRTSASEGILSKSTLHSPLRQMDSDLFAGAESWIDIPTEILRAELLRRADNDYEKPECGSNGARGSYNTSLHVAALILILVLSTAGQYLVFQSAESQY